MSDDTIPADLIPDRLPDDLDSASPLDDQLSEQLDTSAATARSADPPCTFICGQAGTGKTFSVRERIAADPSWGLLCATTGIAAVNLNAITINSTLKYFDTDSLRDSYLQGSLVRILHGIAKEYRNLVVDEVSMMDADQLDLVCRALREANGFRDVPEPMGIVCVGDFAQLPVVRGRWAFDADCWPKFAARTERLTKMWRQDQQEFLMALNAARRGEGKEAADRLTATGIEWHTSLDVEYDGTTIVPKNDQVARYNEIALDRVPGKRFTVTSRRWGKQRPEWGQNKRTQEWGIPPTAEFKLGAYVMLLANHPEFCYVNGDTGHIEEFVPARVESGQLIPEHFRIKLVRNGATVDLFKLVRSVDERDRPDGWHGDKLDGPNEYVPRPHLRGKKYVLGQVEFYPLRLAYASTVHKSQGLSLDRCQIDFRNQFFGAAAMMYVALSRCRTLEGLRLVGMKEVFAQRCKVDERVRPWL